MYNNIFIDTAALPVFGSTLDIINHEKSTCYNNNVVFNKLVWP